jgi:hypothetical protein
VCTYVCADYVVLDLCMPEGNAVYAVYALA